MQISESVNCFPLKKKLQILLLCGEACIFLKVRRFVLSKVYLNQIETKFDLSA
jgi:hypothetical protein